MLGGGKAVPEEVLEGRKLRELMDHYPHLGYTLKDHQRQEELLRQCAPFGLACTIPKGKWLLFASELQR